MGDMAARQRAFTLLELIAAMALMVVVAACLYSSLYTGFRARRSAAAAVEPTITVANAIELLKQDIYCAVSGDGILAGSFLGMDSQDGKGGDNDSLSFYTTHLYASKDKPYGGVGMVELVLAPDGEADGECYRLVRYINTNLLSPRTLEYDEQVLCRNVRSLNLRYFDGLNWLDEWDSTAYENSLPQAVEISLQIEYKSRESAEQSQLRELTESFLIPCGSPQLQDSQART
jgi:prepilin-type N-terminal cleavage/methylation domain-containing protein